MMYRHEITVSGKGRFPFDMLRYDQCFPKNPDSVSAMSRRDGDEFEVTVVTIRKSKLNPFTIERWNSFNVGVFNYCSFPMSGT